MTKFLQILLIVVAIQWFETNGKPLFHGISFQKGFEINFKPLLRKPIAFIKEKWSPFGVFGRKHAIEKRNIGSVMTPGSPAVPVPVALMPELRPAAPVFEHVDEENMQTYPVNFLPPLIPVAISSPIPPPLISSILPQPIISPVPALMQVIITPSPRPVFSEMSPPALVPNTPVSIESGMPPISSNMIIPPPGLLTDISRAQPVREYINSVQPVAPPLAMEENVAPPLETNNIKPETPSNDIVVNDNSFIRGSKLALYFGNVFLQLMSQFLTNARSTFDQMTNPPPLYRN